MNRVVSRVIPLLKGPKFGGSARLLNVHEYVSSSIKINYELKQY